MLLSSKFVNKPKFVRKADRYCKICNIDFRRPSEYKTHLSKTLKHNLDARQYPCQHCGKLFTQTGSRDTHSRTHSRDRPKACKPPSDENKPVAAPAPWKTFTHTFRVSSPEDLPTPCQQPSQEPEPDTPADVPHNPFLDPFDDQPMFNDPITNLGASSVDFTTPAAVFDVAGQRVLLNYYPYSDWVGMDASSPSSGGFY